MDTNKIIALARDLCAFATGVVADDNEKLFARIAEELPLTFFRYRSGDSFNGWLVACSQRSAEKEAERKFRSRVKVCATAGEGGKVNAS